MRRSRGPALDAPGEVAEAAGVASEHDVGVEHGDERIEITIPGGGEEGFDDLALGGQVGVWDGGAADAAAGAADQLTRRLGERSTIGALRTARRTCRAGRTPAAPPG
jgi:hypothetical protein